MAAIIIPKFLANSTTKTFLFIFLSQFPNFSHCSPFRATFCRYFLPVYFMYFLSVKRVSFIEQKFLFILKSKFLFFFSLGQQFWCCTKKPPPNSKSFKFTPILLSLRSSILSHFTFSSTFFFQLIFMKDVCLQEIFFFTQMSNFSHTIL